MGDAHLFVRLDHPRAGSARRRHGGEPCGGSGYEAIPNAVALDLSDAKARRLLFERLAGETARALVITEGLVIYLRAEEVGALAEDLKRFPAFKRWALDIASPGLLRMLQENTHQQFGAEVPLLQFAPEDGPAFFARCGWNPICTPCCKRLLG
jgi:O-methyltransferase involved in polyketide biosynthesis